MGKILKANVTLRKGVGSFPVTFFAGEELPDEYVDLVGEHLFGGKAKPKTANKKAEAAKPKEANKKKADSQPKKEDVPPSLGGSKASWLAFAESKGVKVPSDAGRDDIIDLVHQEFPELKG